MRLALALLAAWYGFCLLAGYVVANATGDIAWAFWSRVLAVFGG